MSDEITALTITSDPIAAIVPRSMPEALQLAAVLAKSKFLPDGINDEANVFAIIATGLELGLAPMAALRALYVHPKSGKPTMYADTMVALCRSRPDICEYIRPIEITETSATYEGKRRDMKEPRRVTWNVETATKAKLLPAPNEHSPWGKFPRRMFAARAKAELCKDLFEEVLMGLSAVEEADPDVIDMVQTGTGAFVAAPTAPTEEPKANPEPDDDVPEMDVATEPEHGHVPPDAEPGKPAAELTAEQKDERFALAELITGLSSKWDEPIASEVRERAKLLPDAVRLDLRKAYSAAKDAAIKAGKIK